MTTVCTCTRVVPLHHLSRVCAEPGTCLAPRITTFRYLLGTQVNLVRSTCRNANLPVSSAERMSTGAWIVTHGAALSLAFALCSLVEA